MATLLVLMSELSMGLPMVEMDDLWVPKKVPMDSTREIMMGYRMGLE